MEPVCGSRGDTSIFISCEFPEGTNQPVGDGGGGDDDPPVLLVFRVYLMIPGYKCVHRCVTSVESTLGAISAELDSSGAIRDRGFSIPIRHWLPEISAAAQEATRKRAGFVLHARITLVARKTMLPAVLAINAGLAISPGGELEMSGGEGLETVLFSNGEDAGGQGECAICLEEFVEGAKLARMHCSHAFHAKCLYSWLEMQTACPLCRKSAGRHARERD